MPDHYIIPISGTGREIGDTVALGNNRLEVIGREGIIHDLALGHQVYVSEGELAGVADDTKVLSGCIIIAFKCGAHDPPCEYQVVYRKLE